MQVILNQDVKGHGKKGQMVKVSDGYARNYLLPRGLAKEATKDNINVMKGKQESLEYKIKTETEEAKAIVEKLNPLAAKFYQDFNELFKALTPAQIFQIRNNARIAAIEHGWYKERFTFNDWIKYIFESAKQQATLNANPDVVKK